MQTYDAIVIGFDPDTDQGPFVAGIVISTQNICATQIEQ